VINKLTSIIHFISGNLHFNISCYYLLKEKNKK
jgi:hypothetical protein